jgi:hypothetical protein
MEERDLYDEIARLAYEIFERSGYCHGCDVGHWLEAERIVVTRYSVTEEGLRETEQAAAEKAPAKTARTAVKKAPAKTAKTGAKKTPAKTVKASAEKPKSRGKTKI